MLATYQTLTVTYGMTGTCSVWLGSPIHYDRVLNALLRRLKVFGFWNVSFRQMNHKTMHQHCHVRKSVVGTVNLENLFMIVSDIVVIHSMLYWKYVVIVLRLLPMLTPVEIQLCILICVQRKRKLADLTEQLTQSEKKIATLDADIKAASAGREDSVSDGLLYNG